MSSPAAFAEAIRTMVAQEIHNALGPYRETLASLVEFTGVAPGKSAANGAEAAAPARNPRGRKPAGVRGAKASLEIVSKFAEGQKVQYRQGRGTFEARVVGIDAENGTVTLERLNDKKQVVRPAAKVIAA